MPKTYCNEVEFNLAQKKAINELIIHVFGSFDNYGIYKNSGKPFPDDYKYCKKAIANEIFGPEKFSDLIALCHKATIPQTSFEQKDFEGKGSNGGGVRVEGEQSVIVDTTNHVSGNKKPHQPWDSSQYKTYKTRITSLQSIRRRANWTESEILKYSIKYTEQYNRKFGMNFKVYISEKRKEKA